MKIIFLLVVLLFGGDSVGKNTARIAPKIVKEAHKYHGILFSEKDIYSYYYFFRKGKKCRLFTKAFLTHYKEKRKWKNIKDLQ